MNLLHIIPVLGAGGPARSLLALVKSSRITHPHVRHSAISLQPGDYMPLTFDLRGQGVTVLRAPPIEETIAQIEHADVVLVHFWNTPRIWRLFASDLPAARYLVWSKVLGAHAPQMLNARLLASAGKVVLTAPPPAHLAAQFDRVQVVPGLVDRERLAGLDVKAHDGFHADYIGTTNRGKMHPGFIEMMARLDIPQIRVRICGGPLEPAMAATLSQVSDPGRFECRGFVENIGSILETSDVFAYPLALRTYATSDKSLQEAMLAGVPPVIFPHGGPSRFVLDGHNGIVAGNEDEFVAAIEHLHRHPEKRKALGREARRSAEALFATERHAADLIDVAEAVRGQDKRPLLAGDRVSCATSAAGLFLISQGWDGTAAEVAVREWLAGKASRLMAYADGLDDDAFQVEGGILHWRKEAIDDPLLRAWTARWLMRHGREAEARAELADAARLEGPGSALRHHARSSD